MDIIAKDIETNQKERLKIGITYNLKQDFLTFGIVDSEYFEEFDALQTIDAICNIFQKHGFEPVKLGGDINIVEKLKRNRPDFVFNIAEGYYGRNREAYIPAILEMLSIPYSGSDPLTLSLTLDKIMTKKIAYEVGIPTPNYIVVRKIDDLLDMERKINYPMLTKPAYEGSSKGIYNSSKVFEAEALRKNIEFLFKKYPGQPVLVEEFIKGREITVGILGNSNPSILGIMEVVTKDSSEGDFVYSLEVKRDWKELVDYIAPPDLPEIWEGQIRQHAVCAFQEFGCRDFARIDFRISERGEIFLLEINPLPGLSPEYSDLVIMFRKLGMEYENLILDILNHAFLRHNFIKQKTKESILVS